MFHSSNVTTIQIELGLFLSDFLSKSQNSERLESNYAIIRFFMHISVRQIYGMYSLMPIPNGFSIEGYSIRGNTLGGLLYSTKRWRSNKIFDQI